MGSQRGRCRWHRPQLWAAVLIAIITEVVPAGVRGDLSRWLIEPKPGVFIGNVSSRVRDRLWDRVRENAKTGACWLAHEANTEQRFVLRTHRNPHRAPRDFEGLLLIETP